MRVHAYKLSLSLNVSDNVIDCNLCCGSCCCRHCYDWNARVLCRRNTFQTSYILKFRVCDIEIPPLRERKRDLYVLANSVLEDLCNKYDMEMKQFSQEALDVITGYDWPRNVRELENIIERAITVCDGRIVYSENLMIRQGTRQNATLKERIEDSERKIIEDTLFKNNDDRKKTMEELGLSRTVFYEKLKKYGITG